MILRRMGVGSVRPRRHFSESQNPVLDIAVFVAPIIRATYSFNLFYEKTLMKTLLNPVMAVIAVALLGLPAIVNAEWVYQTTADEITDEVTHYAVVRAKSASFWDGDLVGFYCTPSQNRTSFSINPGEPLFIIDDTITVQYRVDKNPAGTISLSNLHDEWYRNQGQSGRRLAKELQTGSQLIIRMDTWTGRFSLDGSATAIGKVFENCPFLQQ